MTMLMSDPSILNYANKGGIVGLLVIIVYGGFRKDPWWVFGWVYRDTITRLKEMKAEKDAWRTSALKSGDISLTLIERAKETTRD